MITAMWDVLREWNHKPPILAFGIKPACTLSTEVANSPRLQLSLPIFIDDYKIRTLAFGIKPACTLSTEVANSPRLKPSLSIFIDDYKI